MLYCNPLTVHSVVWIPITFMNRGSASAAMIWPVNYANGKHPASLQRPGWLFVSLKDLSASGCCFALWPPSLHSSLARSLAASPRPSLRRSPVGAWGLKWHTVADCRPGARVLALAGWICVAAGEPTALFLACSINSGGTGTDWRLTLISDSGADVQLLNAAHTTGGEEVERRVGM